MRRSIHAAAVLGMAAVSSLFPAGVGAQGHSEAAKGSPGPSDAVIAHIAVTANAIDVSMAKLALERAGSKQVRAFASTMVSDHTAVNKRAAALAAKLKLTPEDNATSRSLQSGAAEARKKLEGLKGAAFDRAYMEREVSYHQAVLDALDKTLIPNADNAELKELLQDARTAVAAHLVRAKAIRSGLSKGAGS